MNYGKKKENTAINKSKEKEKRKHSEDSQKCDHLGYHSDCLTFLDAISVQQMRNKGQIFSKFEENLKKMFYNIFIYLLNKYLSAIFACR